MRKVLLALVASTGFAASAHAGILYSNDFNTDNGGATALNYTGFSGLTVTEGTVDLVHTGDGYGIVCEGGAGGCVDLDGSTNHAGVLSSGSYGYAAGADVSLALAVSGSQRAGYGTDGLTFGFTFAAPTSGTYSFSNNGVDLFSGSFTDETSYTLQGYNFAYNDPFQDVVFRVTPTTAGSLGFFINGTSLDGADSNNDNVGIILDNVSLSAVPEPASWAMMIGGFGLVGGAMRTRRRTVTALRHA